MKPLLVIDCLTYNHEKFIKQTLDGFVMQKTNFKFEVLIHDDASTDNTANIIREYEKKYPNIIKPIYQTENQWQKGVSIPKKFQYPRIKAKYVALCEGDDYWTDPYKLQKQVDFLEAHPDYSICFHPVRVIYENNPDETDVFPTKKILKNDFSFKHLFKINFIQTNSVVYRWRFIEENIQDHFPDGILPGDWYLHLLHAQTGKIKMLPEIMAVYRRHSGGIWYDESPERDNLHQKHGLAEIKFYHSVYKNIAGNSEDYLYKIIAPQWKNIINSYLKIGNFDAIKTIKETYPDEFAAIFRVNNEKTKLKKYKKLYQAFWIWAIAATSAAVLILVLFAAYY